MSRVALVTGASSGIGFAVCEQLLKKDWTVYGLSRRGTGPEGIRGLIADVSDEASCIQAVSRVMKEAGQIDLLVNNAGFGISGPIEFTEEKDAHDQMRVNFFGQFFMAKAVLPYMREKKSGHIVFVSSVAGEMAIPYQAFYSAGKAAVNSLALALRNEVKDFGIKISAVMPGDARTGFTDVRRKEASGDTVYVKNVSAVAAMEKDERNGMTPAQVADVILKAGLSKNPAPFYIAGGKYKVFHLLFKLFPARFVYWVIGLMYS
ncbi:MAG: SDR family oxidoreductase [Lachnospiraceae bacterium]|nr:SDR family oxidoreductase [Lachnospiraceae bacterium]